MLSVLETNKQENKRLGRTRFITQESIKSSENETQS
jgi:hypothetical protein